VPVDVFFEKPVRPDDLLKAVSGLLKQDRLHDLRSAADSGRQNGS